MDVEILGVDSGVTMPSERQTTRSATLCSSIPRRRRRLARRTFRFLYAPTLRQRSQDHAEHSSRPRRSYFLQD